MADDGQPEAEAAVAPRRGGVGLPEALEDVRQPLRVDADALVADLDAQPVAALPFPFE